MPPKNKAKGRNGFYYFMQDVRNDESEKGHVINTMEELTEFAGPLWKELSIDEKEFYNRRAKDEKFKGSTDMERKFNSLGVSFAAAEANDREFDEQIKIMKATIKNLVQSSSALALIRKPFFLCHVNHYFEENRNFRPAEISLAQFTIENGLGDTLHYILHPGEIPIGVRGAAQNWADKTHGIRLVDKLGETLERERNYVQVYSDIVQFLKRDAMVGQGSMVLPIIFTMPDSLINNTSMTAVKSCLSYLSGWAHEKRDLFRVYSLPELFFNLRKKFGDSDSPMLSVAIFENEIEKDVFSYAPNLGCEYHEMKDKSVHCSLSIVKRWAFTICDHISHLAGVDMIPGQHAPLDAEVNWTPVKPKSSAMNPKSEVGYVEPPPNQTSLKFVDLSKMQELRIREKEAVEEQLSEARSLPPPLRPVFGGGPPPPGFSDTDFPPIGRGSGGGRGLLPKVGSGIWPISGRGKLAK